MSEVTLQKIEAELFARRAWVDRYLRDKGRHDLADELVAKLRDIDMGVDAACGTWASLSVKQRAVMIALKTQPRLKRTGNRYTGAGIIEWCHVRTVRSLIARGLLDCEGGAFDPEAELVLSDKGRFLLKHGQPLPPPPQERTP